MQNSTLIETLSVFSSEELLDFHKFVHSPFFNDGAYAADCTALWNYIRPHAPAFNAEALQAEKVFKQLFPGKPYSKNKLGMLMSKLHQLAKQYILTIAPPILEVPENLRLATFYRKRGLRSRTAPLLEKLQQEQAENTIRDAQYWYERAFTEKEQHLLDTDLQNHHDHTQLSQSIVSLHHAHLIDTLNQLNELYSAKRKSNIKPGNAEAVADTISSALQALDLEQEPVLRLLKTGFDFIRNPEAYDKTALYKFRDELETYAAFLPSDMLSALYGDARNLCTWHFNRGQSDYAEINLALFKSCYDRGLLFENGKIQAATYLNLVQAGLIARDFKWLKSVMPDCRERLIGVPAPLELYHYTLANYHYHLHEYDRALDLLQAGSDDLFNNLMLRKLELKIYYETDSPLLDSKMENFKLFVFRQGKKNLPPDIFQMNNNFIDLLKAITASVTFGKKERVRKLLQKLDDTELLAERSWLKTQLENLK
jgi:hypothetical protein